MLKQLQEQFSSDVVGLTAKGDYIKNGRFSQKQLVQVYHNNYYVSLTEALVITYPGIIKLVGQEFFEFICRKFIKQHPHQSGDLTLFGEQLNTYIENSPECKNLPYLADIAKLEWAFELAYHAKDVTSQDLSLLETTEPAAYSQLKFTINPGCFIVESNYPIFDIWKFDGQDELDINAGGQNVLIWKQDFEVLTEVVEADFINFLGKLQAGKNLEQALGENSKLDLNQTLSTLVSRKIVHRVYDF